MTFIHFLSEKLSLSPEAVQNDLLVTVELIFSLSKTRFTVNKSSIKLSTVKNYSCSLYYKLKFRVRRRFIGIICIKVEIITGLSARLSLQVQPKRWLSRSVIHNMSGCGKDATKLLVQVTILFSLSCFLKIVSHFHVNAGRAVKSLSFTGKTKRRKTHSKRFMFSFS